MRRLEQALDTCADDGLPEEDHTLFRSELAICATGRRNELGCKVIVKGFCS